VRVLCYDVHGARRSLSSKGLTVGVEGVWMVVQWRVMAVLSRCCAVPSSSIDVLDRGDVLRSGDTGDVARLRYSPLLLPLLPLLSWLGCTVDGHQVAAGRWENSRALGMAL